MGKSAWMIWLGDALKMTASPGARLGSVFLMQLKKKKELTE